MEGLVSSLHLLFLCLHFNSSSWSRATEFNGNLIIDFILASNGKAIEVYTERPSPTLASKAKGKEPQKIANYKGKDKDGLSKKEGER